jgi:hypothetical protein
MLDELQHKGFEVLCTSHASAILSMDFPSAINELGSCLGAMELPITEIIGSGGGEAKSTQRLRRSLSEGGWQKTIFEVKKTINGTERESISHEVDHVRTFDAGEPPRLSRRLQPLRGLGHEHREAVLT